MQMLRGQGATEYLVLLAVVLIVALVSVALLGFFPGMASDAQLTQSKAYWSSTQPISIIEAGTIANIAQPNRPYVYLRLRNNGGYKIQITKILGESTYINSTYTGTEPGTLMATSSYFGLAPGEETYIGAAGTFGLPSQRLIYFHQTGTAGDAYSLPAANPICAPSNAQGVIMVVKNFGFEYIEYIDNQQITKRQVGAKDFLVKCTGSA